MKDQLTTQKPKVEREFKLTSLAVNNRTSVFVLTFLIILVGIFAYTSMPKESFPEVEIPTIYIGTVHPGNSPADMESFRFPPQDILHTH